MAVTIYDLAREAGVGIGTVSRCLNNHPSVSPKTRAKVMAVVKRLSYQPHAYAQRLASKKTNTISLIIPYFTNYFSMQVLQGVQDKATEIGFDLILYGVTNPSQVEYYLRRSLHRGHVDGVMIISMKLPDTFAAKFHQMKLPLVLVDSYHPEFDSIRVQNREGGLAATRHLIQLGHTNIAMINASLETLPARDRMEGYRAALEEAGFAFSEEGIFSSSMGGADGYNREAGRFLMNELIDMSRRGPRFTSVFVASDIQAIGALEVAEERGVRVPEDIAMVGFDDIDMAHLAQLTTMRQPMHEMGFLALEKLHARMKDSSISPTVTSFMPKLIERRSSGPSRTATSRPDA